jgi:hypothetical protein
LPDLSGGTMHLISAADDLSVKGDQPNRVMGIVDYGVARRLKS